MDFLRGLLPASWLSMLCYGSRVRSVGSSINSSRNFGFLLRRTFESSLLAPAPNPPPALRWCFIHLHQISSAECS
ncbi:hypothetical protein P152DRAFT_454505 [Eremomyces bilateralis CBS 781.70]|uniref:Uncharacterized protein n=1 Tax=Eremomyces bilateralis CBS 781.70 TaxID=1392243 RepID=A0A6G1GEB3_9PEZI|nr:uncharacterized protein P152DRAFT_454505 [Eremomyces bilateralis CBS 781.70]KAF1816246.1 hypothetical protein P152DRAFT_454505 [Eremomyces bilateralis CBS 781.70]